MAESVTFSENMTLLLRELFVKVIWLGWKYKIMMSECYTHNFIEKS
jgi:hypothetical protein